MYTEVWHCFFKAIKIPAFHYERQFNWSKKQIAHCRETIMKDVEAPEMDLFMQPRLAIRHGEVS